MADIKKARPVRASLFNMVDRGGEISNPESPLFSAWNGANKTETELTPEVFEELFDTLADWNDYLENHLPSFEELSL